MTKGNNRKKQSSSVVVSPSSSSSSVSTQDDGNIQEGEESSPPHWLIAHLIKVLPYFLSFGDSAVFVFEFLFINTLITLGLSTMTFISKNSQTPTSVYTCLAERTPGEPLANLFKCILSNDILIILSNVAHVFMWACLTCSYFIWRYKVDFKRVRKLKLSKTALFVFFISICGVLALYSIQQRTGHWIYSTENLNKNVTREVDDPSILLPSSNIENSMDEDDIDVIDDSVVDIVPRRNITLEFVDYERIFHLVFGAPMIEEVVLRIALTTVIQRRLQTVMSSIIWTNVIFSSLHVINALQNASSSYTMFQVLAGFILGTFYSTRLYITGNLYESLSLHVLNNLTAIWIPVTLTWKDIIPDFALPLFLTQLVYIVLLIKDLMYIRRAHKSLESMVTTEETATDDSNNAQVDIAAKPAQKNVSAIHESKKNK